MSLLSEEQMSGISPQRKNRNKCKNKTRNDNSDQIPSHVLDEINRILDGRESPIGLSDNQLNNESKSDDCEDIVVHKPLFEHNLEPKSGRCLLCRCQHNPDRARLLSALELMSDSPQVSLWFCSSCKKVIEKEKESNCSVTLKVTATNSNSNANDCSLSATTTISSSTSIATQTTNSLSTTTTSTSISVTTTSCSCSICKKHEGQQHEDLRSYWHELKSAILRIYRESGLVLNQTFMQQNRMELTLHQKCPLPSNERLKEIVHKLCVHDRHKLYQCLEAQVRLFVVEMRLNLLKHLEHGSQALFEAMIDQYGKLCRASKKSAQFLQELESKHLRKFNLTWEFLNRRLFQSTVYCDTFIKHGLPKLTALTKDRSLIDMYARFLKFEDEMTVISVVWREAQQFIDKYEKFAILNKKRALIKEWEQLSVEWVLDDHVSGAGKAKSGDSPMCIKKPSIECLNARFLEEQKLLKSGKNMQSVNIAVETQSALQEQMLLAAYGEWDAIDIKTISNISPTNKQLKSATASTQVDMLLTTKSKCDLKTDDPNEEDDCDDEDEEEDDDEDVDDEEDDDDDDDSCSDQSSTTSTSTSNNQRGEGGRVCDCCYCEVFGHGMPAVAPTSRNYNEMRERLRMRLSKRKAEKCEKSGATNAIAIENNIKPKENNEVEDKRDLEELINFINGTDNNVKDKKKKEKQKKKKEKKTDVKKEKENKPISNNSNSKTAENKIQKFDKSIDHSKQMNGSNHCHQNNIKLKEQQPKHDHLVHDSKLNHQMSLDLLTTNQMTHSVPNCNNSINGVTNGNTRNKNGNNKKKIKISNEKKEDNNSSQTAVDIQNQNLSVSHNKTNERLVCNGVIPHHKTNGNISNGSQQLSLSPERVDSDMRHIKAKQNKIHKNKKKNNSDETLSPDDVFMPKDIDLDNGELDEFEKELEAFKRFCFNSVPLARKEKVNVNLKDIVIKKKNGNE